MKSVNVKSLAVEIKTKVFSLVQLFASAGIDKKAIDYVNQQEKDTLLAHLHNDRGNTPKKVTLQRKTRSTLNITGGKSKSVQIEVRQKRTYVQIYRDSEKMQEKSEVIDLEVVSVNNK
jgi:translation initiation factor IF-2